MGKRIKLNPLLMDIRHLVAKPQKRKQLIKLPKKDHTYGYYRTTISEIMNIPELEEFWKWMEGQTCMLHKGKIVYYEDDVRRFLELRRFGKETYWD